MSAVPSTEVAWLIIAMIAAATVLGCLRVIGVEYTRAVRWHDLKVGVRRLRREQEQRLESLREGEGWQPRWARSHRSFCGADGQAAPAPTLMHAVAPGGTAADAEVIDEGAAGGGVVEILEAAAA